MLLQQSLNHVKLQHPPLLNSIVTNSLPPFLLFLSHHLLSLFRPLPPTNTFHSIINSKAMDIPISIPIPKLRYNLSLGAAGIVHERLKVMISGAPASGKGTQCEMIVQKDTYRIGTLMELVRDLALSFADDGKRVKVCVQGSMGVGALAGIPLQLAGTQKILEFMDWGDYGVMGTFINIGSIGAKEVDEQDDMFIIVAPQNAVGNCIIEDLQAMTDAAGKCPVLLINPRLKTMGRDKRLEYAALFGNCYLFRLLYYAGTLYPIMGALRMSYPYPYEVYKRVDELPQKEKYVIVYREAKW